MSSPLTIGDKSDGSEMMHLNWDRIYTLTLTSQVAQEPSVLLQDTTSQWRDRGHQCHKLERLQGKPLF